MAKTQLNTSQLLTQGNNNIATDAEVAAIFNDHLNDVNPHSQYLKEIKANIPGGYPLLDASGKISSDVIPSQSIVTIIQAADVDGGMY